LDDLYVQPRGATIREKLSRTVQPAADESKLHDAALAL
jgi:hypothetical protein